MARHPQQCCGRSRVQCRRRRHHPLSNFAIGDLEQLQYIYGGETITLNYDSGSWTLADDPDYHLDASACNTMATALSSLTPNASSRLRLARTTA